MNLFDLVVSGNEVMMLVGKMHLKIPGLKGAFAGTAHADHGKATIMTASERKTIGIFIRPEGLP